MYNFYHIRGGDLNRLKSRDRNIVYSKIIGNGGFEYIINIIYLIGSSYNLIFCDSYV